MRARILASVPHPPRAAHVEERWDEDRVVEDILDLHYLNGEIVALGRAYDVPTPVNAALQRIAARAVECGVRPGSLPRAELEAAVQRGG